MNTLVGSVGDCINAGDCNIVIASSQHFKGLEKPLSSSEHKVNIFLSYKL